MAEAFGATAAATTIIIESLRLIRRVTSTIKDYKNHDSRLECIYNDLSGIIEIIELVDEVEPLGTTRVSNAVTNMLEHAKKLDVHIQSLKEKHSTRTTTRQVVSQLMIGTQDLEDTKRMVDELTSLKATLILEIQVVQIRLSVERGQAQQNDPGCAYGLNSVFLHDVIQAAKQRLGEDKGLKIASVLQSKKQGDGGMIYLTKEEYEFLASEALGEDEANSQPSPIRVADNTSTDDATQVNGSVGDVEITHIQTIEGNQAHGKSFQINGAMDGISFNQFLESRSKTIEAMAEPCQRQQPRSMHQQLMNGTRQPRSHSPRPNYRRPGVVKRPKPLQGALPGPRQFTSVVVSQVREDDGGTRTRSLASLDITPFNSNEGVS